MSWTIRNVHLKCMAGLNMGLIGLRGCFVVNDSVFRMDPPIGGLLVFIFTLIQSASTQLQQAPVESNLSEGHTGRFQQLHATGRPMRALLRILFIF